MEREKLKEIQILFGDNYVGPEQVNKLLDAMRLPLLKEGDIPEINYPKEVLLSKASDYLLVMGYKGDTNTPLNIINIRKVFGFDPDINEPCFYNQDWYLAEDFVKKTLERRWYLIKKEVFEDSRAVMPTELINKKVSFPTAILCVYTFFIYYFSYNHHLWYHDFVWCSDLDHNGDRIYVGKYHDIDGVNKNGFSIHRHLALRPCYAAINSL